MYLSTGLIIKQKLKFKLLTHTHTHKDRENLIKLSIYFVVTG